METEDQLLDDAEQLRDDIKELPEGFTAFISMLKDFESTYRDIPENIVKLDSLTDQKTKTVLDEIEGSKSSIENLIEEINIIEDSLKSAVEATESLKEDLKKDKEVLEETEKELR